MPRISSLIAQVSTLLPKITSALCLPIPSRTARSRSFFERLPVEIILIICDLSERPAQVLLSLTCKRLYDVVDANLSSNACNVDDNIEISRCLEVGWPEYLTCRLCGILYEWRRQALVSFACPCPTRDVGPEREGIWPMSIPVYAREPIILNFQVVDLIFRYYERGPEMGIPAGFLNRAGVVDWRQIHQETRARWVEGQLIVHIKYVMSWESLRTMESSRRDEICRHNHLLWCEWRTMDVRPGPWETCQDIETVKCPYCDCDASISQQRAPDGSVMVVVEAWRNYGNSSSTDLSWKQMDYNWNVRTDQDTLARRNLRELFDSGKDWETEDDIRKITYRLEVDEQLYPTNIWSSRLEPLSLWKIAWYKISPRKKSQTCVL